MKAKKEKEVRLIIIRRHEPDGFLDLMLRLSPVFSEWQAESKTECEGKPNLNIHRHGRKKFHHEKN
jgi:hypothetical protein